jgi:uncharacterized damage-inducible protein DinB
MSRTPSLMSQETYMVEQALRSCIEQLLDVIDLLPDEIYVAQAAPQDSSIGCHFRHIIEFIQMLREQAPEGCADYERRNRVKVLEQDRSAARLSVKENGRLLLEILGDLGADYAVAQSQTPFESAGKIQLKTSLGREAMFVIDHAIHHLALIRVLASRLGVELPRSFGLAVSTQEHMREQGASS